MNHRTTSACNCISVPIINVSTAILFMKAVIIKSQVGEIWNKMLILRNLSCAIQCPSTKTPNLLERMNCPGEFIFWNSIWKWFLGIWVPIKALCVTHGFLNILWNWGGTKARKLFTTSPTDLLSEFGAHGQWRREGVLHLIFSQECLLSKQKTRMTEFPTHVTPTKHPTLQDSQPLNCLQNARTV